MNAGSLDPDIAERYGITPVALVESAKRELGYFEEVGFDAVKISVKASDVRLMVESYELLADTVDFPLHLGVTEAGPPPAGLIKSTAGIATLLQEGIGDTIRYSLTADPVEEARAGRQLLEALGLRERKGTDLIACPSCGRAEVDVIAVAAEAQKALEAENLPLQVAVMGCVVNGPGEARGADPGRRRRPGRGHLFVKGEVVKVARGRDGLGVGRMGPAHRRRWCRCRPRAADAGRQPRPTATGGCSWMTRATTPTTPRRRSSSSASSSNETSRAQV